MNDINKKTYAALIICLFVIVIAIFGPEFLSGYKDRYILDNITIDKKDSSTEGYKYILNNNEKMFLLSNALTNRVLPQSDYYSSIKPVKKNNENKKMDSFALLSDTTERNISKEDIILILNDELTKLIELEIIPSIDLISDNSKYNVEAFKAVDVLEPRKGVSVWQIELNSTLLIEKESKNSLINCFIDVDTSKIYSFAIRTNKQWEDYDANNIINSWGSYLNVNELSPYISETDSIEFTTDYKKFYLSNIDDEKIIITIGFYEGINEFFIEM